jgi:electron transfer flavoprotein beta subunit
MRIIVPIKQVPETNAVKMDEVSGTMIREGVEAIINPLDLYAIEAAILLREQYGGEVIALSMGPSKAITALKEAIAMGIDRAVLLSHKAFAGSDTWATSFALATAIRKMGSDSPKGDTYNFDLVLCGERATDGDTGTCRVQRLVEEGYEILELQMPAVLTVVKEVATPRLPTLRGKQKAKRAEIPVWGPDELQVPSDEIGLKGSPTRVVKIFRPKITRHGQKIPAGDEQGISSAVDQLLHFLQQRELL